MSRYDFWEHGVNTIVEFPERATRILHAGWGTLVEQEPGPNNNWFHLPIATPTVLRNDGSVSLKYVRLRAQVNQNARLDEIHFRVDGNLAFRADGLLLTDRTIDQRFDNPNFEINGALCLSMRIEFLTGAPIGQVIFRGAGGRFDS